MKLGLLTAAFPDTPLTEVADWAAGQRLRRCSRSPAGRAPTARRGATPACRHIDCADLSDDQAKELVGDLAERGVEISGARLLPEPAAPRPRAPRRGDRPPRPRHHGGRQARRARSSTRSSATTRTGRCSENFARVHQGVAGHRRPRRRPRRQDRHRELPDDLLRRRVAGRQQPDAHAGGVARRVRPPRRRHARAQPRPVAPRVADDRLRAGRARVRRPHLPRPRQGHGDRPRGPLRARRAVGRDRAGRCPACPGSARCAGTASSARCTGSGYDYAVVVEHEDRQFEGSDEKVKAGFLLARNAVAPYIV